MIEIFIQSDLDALFSLFIGFLIIYSFYLIAFSELEVNVTVRDAIQTDLDSRANILLIQKFGVNMEVKKGIRAFYVFHKYIYYDFHDSKY